MTNSLSFLYLEATPGFGPGIRVLQTRALPLGYSAIYNKIKMYMCKNGAGNGAQTRDLCLGKAALYQLSYSRVSNIIYVLKLNLEHKYNNKFKAKSQYKFFNTIIFEKLNCQKSLFSQQKSLKHLKILQKCNIIVI